MLFTRASFGQLSAIIVYGGAGNLPVYSAGLGWEIYGGARGVRVRHLHIEPILLIANDAYVWHCLIFRGVLPKDTTKYQTAQANNTYPSPAASTYDLDLLYYSLLRPARPAAGEQQYPLTADFEDDTGPRVGPGETMGIMVIPAFLPGGAIVLGNSAFVAGTVLGGDDIPGGEQFTGRSIPRGKVGGI